MLKAHHLGELPWPSDIAFWTLSAAPGAGWAVATGLVNRYAHGAATYGEVGGAETHTHTLPSHSHGGATSGASNSNMGSYGPAGGNGGSGGTGAHTHSVGAGSGTYAADTNHPPYRRILPVYCNQAAGGSGPRLHDFHPEVLPPANALGMQLHAGAPKRGWAKADGSDAAVPNLNGRLLRGAAAAGGTGGSSTHTHSDAHTHTSGGPSATVSAQGGSGYPDHVHTHTATETVASSAESHMPSYVNTPFVGWKGVSANGSIRLHDLDPSVRPFSGLLVPLHAGSTAPVGWNVATSMQGYFALHTDAAGTNVNTTGGTFGSHTHSGGASHSHTLGASGTPVGNDTGGASGAAENHTHTLSGGSSPGGPSVTLPPYYDVFWVSKA